MAVEADTPGERRSSIEKPPIVMPAFDRLPDEIIEQILQATDPNSFASLILLNTTWRRVSQQAHLYAHQLAYCPSYSASHHAPPASTTKEEDLPGLRRLFAREVKRNLFEAYLRPRQTVIKVISNSISSSSCPGGEGLQFSPSPLGHHILAYNSSRIYVIDLRGSEIDVRRELKILRRPASACIKDDGSVLAVLSSEMQVDIYDLEKSPPRRTQSIILDHSPRTIALSPCGSVLAAAYEGGIEVSSLNPGALATDRRAVKCDAVDALAFSFDGTQILGTTVQSSPPTTVILTAPYYDPGSAMCDDNMSQLWTTSILFPNTSRDCSHAVLLQDSRHEEASWTFTYDRSFETFRAVRIDDLRNGTTYFTGPIPSPTSQAKLIPSTLPAASYHGDLVSAGFQGKEIWLYGVPEDLDAVPDCASSGTDSGSSSGGLGRRNSGPPSRASSRAAEGSGVRVPQWQLLCDKLRNTFVWGCKVGELDGVSTVKWVADFGSSSAEERLVVAARGISPAKSIIDEEDMDFIDGGRIILLDFDYGTTNGDRTEITIEVGTKKPEVLEEEQRDMDAEVALVRRRTVAQKRGDRNALLRSATTSASRGPAVPPVPANPHPQRRRGENANDDDDDDPLLPRRIGVAPRTNVEPATPTSPSEEQESLSIEEQEALDAPYSHASPRSGTTLRRAATAAAVNRRLHPPPATAGPVEYRRADGRREHPHESDADNWVPPPPPYQKEDPGDLPAFLRHAAVTPAGLPAPIQLPRTQTAVPSAGSSAWPQPQSSESKEPARDQPQQRHSFSQNRQVSSEQATEQRNVSVASQQDQSPRNRIASSSTTPSRPRTEDSSRPMPSPTNRVDIDDIYDVSPPESPRVAARRLSSAQGSQAANHTPEGNNAPRQASSRQSNYDNGVRSSSIIVSPLTSPLSPRENIRAIPMLDLQIPSPTFSASMQWNSADSGSASAAPPSVRRLSNSQTWPRAPQPAPGLQVGPSAGYPYSAPPTGANANDMMAASLPPPPRADQLARLNDHVHQGSPRRLSGGFSSLQRVPVGGRSGSDPRRTNTGQMQATTSMPQQVQMSGAPPERPEPDQPLIISTPRGVAGAYDAPTRQTSGRRNETPLLAPVPRHPRPGPPGSQRPTVERLETIYSIASTGAGQDNATAQSLPNRSFMPSWLSSAPSGSSAGRHTSATVIRKPSRAERSAAKNIQDAKKRGWQGNTKKSTTKKKGKKKKIDYEVASSAAWTDVSRTSQDGQGKGDKKCIVM